MRGTNLSEFGILHLDVVVMCRVLDMNRLEVLSPLRSSHRAPG